MEDLIERFENFASEYNQFERIAQPRSKYKDVHAFLLLESILPSRREGTSMVAVSEHDQIWLETDPHELNAVITDDQILELVRCRVRCTTEGLTMFV